MSGEGTNTVIPVGDSKDPFTGIFLIKETSITGAFIIANIVIGGYALKVKNSVSYSNLQYSILNLR